MNMSEETLNASKEGVSLRQIFTVFAKIGAFTIGGKVNYFMACTCCMTHF